MILQRLSLHQNSVNNTIGTKGRGAIKGKGDTSINVSNSFHNGIFKLVGISSNWEERKIVWIIAGMLIIGTTWLRLSTRIRKASPE